ncbi:MAG: DNA primase [Chitinophagaceae bacterium]|nr:DNA primase [Chitinophagaceae bacterium]
MISRSTIQKVNDTAELLDVVSSFVQLKKRGVNYLGNCPFHNEKTPSFTVSPAKGIYKCFGCGKAGNVITFVQEHEKLSYPEAITWLAKRYNIEIEETQVSNEQREQMQTEESLRIINAYASTYFTEQLMHTDEGRQIGQSYFQHRGFRQETIDKFQLGYCPEDREHLAKEAIPKGYNKDLLIRAGLLSERYEKLQSIYHGRVIFPIHNQSGRIIGFGARILKTSEKSPKYINTPENEIYSKSKTLYGIYFARTSITKQDECYLVEGYTDVISLHQAGVENVVASSGTSLTEEQLKLIKRFTKNLTILYDGDAAGIKAALRGLDMAVEQGLNVHVVMLPDNHDPDSYVQETGAAGFTEYIQHNKKDIILFKLEASLKEAKDDSIKKTELINEIAETLSKINRVEDFTKQQDYVRRCAQLLKIDEAGLVSLVNKKIRDKVVKRDFQHKEEADKLEQMAAPDQTHVQPEINELLRKDYQQEKGLIRVLMEYGDKPFDDKISVADYIRIKIANSDFTHAGWQQIYELYFQTLNDSLQYPTEKTFTYHETEAIRNLAIEALYYPYELSENWHKEYQIFTPGRDITYLDDVTHTVTYFQLRKLKAIYAELMEELRNIPDEDEERINMQAMKDLKAKEQELLQGLRIVAIR